MTRLWIVLFMCLLPVSAFAADAYGDSGQFNPSDSPTANDTRARIHTELAAGFYQRGQYAIALDELNKALSASTNYAMAYDMLGLVYMALGEDAKADTDFNRALQLAPNDPDFHNNYGWFLYNINQCDAALPQFASAYANPLYATPELALSNSALCYLKQGKDDMAIQYFEKSLRYQENQPETIYQLALLYYKQQRYADARDLLGRLIQGNAASAKVLWLGLRIARKMNDHDAEASDSLQLRNRYPSAKETQLLLQGNDN